MILPEHIFKDGMGATAKNFPANLKPIGTGPYKVDRLRAGRPGRLRDQPELARRQRPLLRHRSRWKGGGDATSAARAVLQTGDYNVAWNLQVEPAILNQLQPGRQGQASI